MLAFIAVGGAAIVEGDDEVVFRSLPDWITVVQSLIRRLTPSALVVMHQVRACDCCAFAASRLAVAASAAAHVIVRVVTTIRHPFAALPSCNCAPTVASVSTKISMKQLLPIRGIMTVQSPMRMRWRPIVAGTADVRYGSLADMAARLAMSALPPIDGVIGRRLVDS